MEAALAGAIDRALAPAAAAEDDTTRERILDAALQGAAAVGLGRLTTEEVVRRSGLGRMTVYRRFARRDDLVDALVLRECRRFLAAVAEGLAAGEDPERRVAGAFVAAMRFTRAHPLTRRAAEAEPGSPLDTVAADGGRVLAMGRDFIAAEIRGAGADPARAHQVADVVARLFVTYVGVPPTDPDPADDEALEAFARSTLVPLIALAFD